MMDGIETRLRDGLRQLADQGEGAPDVEALIAAGEALRRRRRGYGAVAGLVAITASVLLVWPALTSRTVPAVPEVVASPSPSATSSAGGEVAAELVYENGRVVVFRDEARGVWGYRDYANDVQQTMPLGTEPVGSLLGLAATVDGEYFLDSTAIGLLPAGGTDPEFTFPHDGINWTSAALGDTGQIVFLVTAERVRQGVAMVDSILYTNPSGERVSYRPSLSQTTGPEPQTPPSVTCEPLGTDLLSAANQAGELDDRALFVDGQMVQATGDWWFVAVKADVTDSEYAKASGINDQDLMAFATNAPSGGSDWIPLGTRADWDGTTPTGESIPEWRNYRLSALGCAGPG